jgi:hypothetical protein
MFTIVKNAHIGMYVCKRTELRCEFISNSVTSHRKHIESMDIEDDKIKHF